MAETCIVCLGDLRRLDATCTDGNSSSNGKSSLRDGDDVEVASHASTMAPSTTEGEMVAHLLPCGHNLHDDCLKPWVERANSCPICRAKFNTVELSLTLGGPAISSYAVQDKQQVADLDPALLVAEDEALLDEHIDPCMVCEEYGDEALLLLCDGCNQSCHVFCAGLDAVPEGAWFCYTCQQDHRVISNRRQDRSTSESRLPTWRSRPRRDGTRSLAWARVWRSVFSRLDFDLEFPFDHDDVPSQRRVEAERREFEEWQRRFQVAARQGAGNRFRETAPIRQEKTPEPESQEEIRAWNAFEKARLLDEDEPRRSSRKRKSRTGSPVDAQHAPEPERKLKRPRTMRTHEQDLTDSAAESSSRANRPENVSAPRPRRERPDANGGPTFLRSLLNEVEAHSSLATPASKEPYLDMHADLTAPQGTERSASPDVSPSASNHATPRSMTPPPFSPTARPSSPPALTSNISPVFPPAPDFSPNAPPVQDSVERARSRQRVSTSRQSPASSPTRAGPIVVLPQPCCPAPHSSSSNASTPKPNAFANANGANALSYKAKSEIQALVKAALKPHYQTQEIDSDQYTDINRDVSRQLYDQIGTEERLEEKERWQNVAREEVEKAVKTLRKEEEEGSLVKSELGLEPDLDLEPEPELEPKPELKLEPKLEPNLEPKSKQDPESTATTATEN